MREVEILKKKQLKCYLYTRVSTSMQVDGYSLDAQRDKLRKYAAYEDMIVAGEYSDEGFSGKNIQGRQEFQRMLNDIQDGKDDVSYVLVFKLSRFGRNAADVLNSLQLMQDFGVNLICVEDGIDSSKDAGKLMISVLSAVAEIERENIRTQTMAGREQKAREGKWNGGFAPYGYKLENGNLVIAEDEVEIILSCEEVAGSTLIKVRDNGIGIPLKEQWKIFNKFERLSANNRKSGISGFGLGLSYVLQVMKAHDGMVSVESVEGSYSEFTMRFPLN